MKNNYSIKKQKKGWIVLMLLFCGLFANTAMGQITYTWNGSTSTSWTDPLNWTPTAGTSYPGTDATDLVVISNGGSPVLASTTLTISKVTISNATGAVTGSTLTINSGATLTVNSTTVAPVVLNGGNLINDGILNITSTAPGISGFLSTGITCANPTVAPGSAIEYGYSGSGFLNINISAATFANSAGVAVTSVNANTTYKMLFNGATSMTLSASTATTYAIRAAGGAAASPLIIGGTGFTLGTVGSPVTGGLLNVAQQSTVTVNAGTTLTLNSASTNLTSGILIGNSSTNAVTFTNRGIINILGASARSGILITTFTPGADIPFTISNEGTINVNLNCITVGSAPLATGNGGNTGTTSLAVNLNNTGTLNLSNTSTPAGTGAAIFGLVAAQAPPVLITNNGTLNLEGSSYSYGNKFSIVNNSILNSNSDFRSFTSITNSAAGSINFVRTAATATTRQVVFNGLALTDVSGAIGSVYSDGTNNYTVVSQKFASGTTLIANVLSAAVTPISGSLTRISGTGTLTIAYTSVTVPAVNGALTSTTTNSGIINTDTASNLSVISGVTTTASSVIAPGGASGKGIADFSKAAATLSGKFILQIAGSAAAGVDYDQITNTLDTGSFTLSSATLDVTGIYTPGGPVTIDIVNTSTAVGFEGTVSGTFSSVIGLTTGWSVNYIAGTAGSVTGKVQLVYAATSPTANTWTGGTSTDWTDTLNWSAGVPDQNSDVTIASATFQPTIATNVNINSLTINSGATLNVNTALNLTVTDAITNNGTLTMADNANLVQVNNVSNTGNIIVNRNSNALSRLDYTIWSSPVTNASSYLNTFSPATSLNRFYNYNQTSNLYTEVANPAITNFGQASGYLIRMPNDAVTAPATQIFAGVFSGVPNNGTIAKAMTYDGALFGYNMVGNPYPSTIDAQTLITANTANIESSLYFWRKINAASGSAYAVYNPLGGTAATPSSAVPNGTIQVGQGFFVKAKSASNLTFNNSMRVANNANQFFKTKAVQKDRLWLNLTNTAGVFSQTLVGYTADATQGLDIFDARYFNDSPVALTSNIDNEEYTIQGRPTFDPTDVVALNFKTDVAGDYTIAIDHTDGVFAATQDVYLVDSKTGAETNLKTGGYTFTATTGVDNTRFSLKYQKTLGVNAVAFNDNSIRVFRHNGTLTVNSGANAMSNIKVFDIQGRLLVEQKEVNAVSATIKNLRTTQQVLLVKVTAADNTVVTKKVIN